MSDTELFGAAAITGFAVWEVHRTYCAMAPSLGELRDAYGDCTEKRQKLLDADVCTGGLAVLAGVTAGWLSKSWVPLVVVGAAILWTSYYHRAVLDGATPNQIDGATP